IELVGAGGAIDAHSIRLAVACGRPEYCEVYGNLLHAGAAQVVDRDIVRTARSRELDALDTVEVHGDGADVAGQRRLPADCRNGDIFVDIRAVKRQRVEPGLTVDGVAAVARVPGEQVVAGAADPRAVARAADQPGGGQRAVDFVEHDPVVAALT